MTSLRLAMAERPRSSAEALLFTTRAASAPVSWQRRGSTWACLAPLRPSSRSNSRSVYPTATRRIASVASRLRGARPRLVWMITPVALMRGVGRGFHREAARSITPSTRSSKGGGSLPWAIWLRASSRHLRARSTTGCRE